MASSNPNWPRWIAASVAVYYKAVADGLNLPVLIEGIDERKADVMSVDHAEVRVNGPFIVQLSAGYFRLNVDSNILLTDIMEGEQAYGTKD